MHDAAVAEECAGWLNGTLGVWCGPGMRAHMPCGKLTGFTSQYGQEYDAARSNQRSWLAQDL